MNTTRLGKIARLPRFIRQQLNTRLEDGVSGEKLLEWVNGLPETQEILAEEFDGKPINKQNLSDWRLGGHQDWVRAREDCELAASLAERAQELGEAAERPNLSDGLGMLLTLHLARQVKAWQSETSEPKERWRQLREMLRELALLRREDSRAQRTEIARQKWAKQAEAMAEEKQEKVVDATLADVTWRRVVAQMEAKSKNRPVLRSSSATEGGSTKSETRKPKPKGRKPKRKQPKKQGNRDTRTRKPEKEKAKRKSKKNSQPSQGAQPGTTASSLAPPEQLAGANEKNECPNPEPTENCSYPESGPAPTGNAGPLPNDSEGRSPEAEKIEDPPSHISRLRDASARQVGAAGEGEGEDEKEECQRGEAEASPDQSSPVKASQAFETFDANEGAEGKRET